RWYRSCPAPSSSAAETPAGSHPATADPESPARPPALALAVPDAPSLRTLHTSRRPPQRPAQEPPPPAAAGSSSSQTAAAPAAAPASPPEPLPVPRADAPPSSRR